MPCRSVSSFDSGAPPERRPRSPQVLIGLCREIASARAQGAERAARRWGLLLWNVAGLADVLYAVLTAMRLRLSDPMEMAAITSFPLSLIPTFVVPLLLITHFILIAQLYGKRARP